MKIAILDDYQAVVPTLSCFERLAAHEVTVFNTAFDSESAMIQALQSFEVLVLIRERSQFSATILSRLPNLRLISQTGKISHHIRLEDCSAHNIAFAEGVGSPTAPAELTWALIMAASRQLLPYHQQLQNGVWQAGTGLGLGRCLKGLTLGIWGYGKIGQKIAHYAQAFDMNVMIWGSDSSRQFALEQGHQVAESRSQFFQTADILSLHLRLNSHTQYSVTLDDLSLMKTNALFVNTSRAELVAPNALLTALRQGRPGFAAVDVYENEPALPANEPLLHLPNVLCSPHLGYVERSSYELYFQAAFDNILAFAANVPVNIANPEVFAHINGGLTQS